ncbi:hypothetical protein BGW80DRAFT_1443580 [Lactifluus volemus]|nr:hypothetical protein BGW80DRAFT_1443580 [Lactifluus volemus]
MMKRKNSKSASRKKKARNQRDYPLHLPSPQAGSSHVEEQMLVDIPAMEISPSVDSRFPSLELVLRIKESMERLSSKDYLWHWCSSGIVSLEVFMKNVIRKDASSFRDLVNNAVTEKDWENVITHDVFWTELPADPLSPAERSWMSNFACREVLKGLEEHVQNQIKSSHRYARYCSIVQSSGMGKSRLLDEFAKEHFVIPVNLRESGTRGFPPPDVVFATSLHRSTSKKQYARHILLASMSLPFVIIHPHKGCGCQPWCGDEGRPHCAFREFMSEGQRFDRVGEQRHKFYDAVVARAKKDFDDEAIATPDERNLLNAFEELRQCLCGQESSRKSTSVDIFIMFDEAHSLAKLWLNSGGLSNYIELQRALTKFSNSSLFTFFLATTGKISQSMTPHLHDSSNRIFEGGYRMPRFLKNIQHWKSHILGMCFPLRKTFIFRWGTMYDHGNFSVRNTILPLQLRNYLAMTKRLALDINSAAYVSAPSTSIREMTLEQIANHMQVCVEIGEENENIRGIAASEPILSEAASSVMRNTDFQWFNTLRRILHCFSVHIGDRGELLVAAFFTHARDMAISLKPSLPPPRCCSHFSVKDLFESLLFEKAFKSMFENTPSICPPTLATKQLKFGKVASAAHMHFNHFIKAQEKKVISHQYLLGFIARGAAVLGTNGQPDFNAIFPYLFDTMSSAKRRLASSWFKW